ncbi:hypothetical protein Acr_00g0099660 [Actinidia rufa]|uniref:Uncharacterized protein n=1 Tax=Actinidia rufa TaxID=165716 RepID=A0A7J0DZP0_9ERIC|nr:hypothetical protein Acr_00g0099660 [Actinidia rufa]
MDSLVPESLETIESYLAPVAPTIALTSRPDLSLSQHIPAHRVTNATPAISSGPTPIADHIAFAASSDSGPRSTGVSALPIAVSVGVPTSAATLGFTATLVTGTPFFSGSDVATILANLDGLPRPIPLFESPQVQIPPASAVRAPLKVCIHCTPPSAPLPNSSSVSGTSPSPLVPTFCFTPLSFSYSSPS